MAKFRRVALFRLPAGDGPHSFRLMVRRGTHYVIADVETLACFGGKRERSVTPKFVKGKGCTPTYGVCPASILRR